MELEREIEILLLVVTHASTSTTNLTQGESGGNNHKIFTVRAVRRIYRNGQSNKQTQITYVTCDESYTTQHKLSNQKVLSGENTKIPTWSSTSNLPECLLPHIHHPSARASFSSPSDYPSDCRDVGCCEGRAGVSLPAANLNEIEEERLGVGIEWKLRSPGNRQEQDRSSSRKLRR